MRSGAVSRVQRLKSRAELLWGLFLFGVSSFFFFGAVLVLRRRRSSSVVALVSCFVVARGCCCWSLVFVAVAVVAVALPFPLLFPLSCCGSLVCGLVFPLDLRSYTVILSHAFTSNRVAGKSLLLLTLRPT